MEKSISDLFDLAGEVAIVTGGLGQLGRQYVQTLVGAGAAVAIFDIRDAASPELAGLVNEKNVIVVKADITKKDEVTAGFQTVIGALGVPTILVNNAGLDSPPHAPTSDNGPFEDFSEASWDAVIDSHLKGMLFMSQEFIRAARKAGKQGSIINISSTYGVVAPDQSLYDFRRKDGEEFYKPVAYSVAKSGVLNFTRWLAEYGARWGIRANTLVPGGRFANQPQEFLKEYNRRTMLGRMANADEYNAAILFLASNKASSYMTGSMLVIDGGWTAR